MALLLNSLSASAALLPGGKMVAQTMPGVTAPFGFFVRCGCSLVYVCLVRALPLRATAHLR